MWFESSEKNSITSFSIFYHIFVILFMLLPNVLSFIIVTILQFFFYNWLQNKFKDYFFYNDTQSISYYYFHFIVIVILGYDIKLKNNNYLYSNENGLTLNNVFNESL